MTDWTGPVVLYRLFNEHGILVYVGVSSDPWTRFKEHSKRDWWGQVAGHTFEIARFRRCQPGQLAPGCTLPPG